MTDTSKSYNFGIVDVVRKSPFIEIFNPLGEYGNIIDFHPFDEKAFQKQIPEIDILLIRLLQIDATTLRRAIRLKAVIKAGVGTDHIDVKTATELGIHVGISLGNHISVAESAMLLMLSISRNLSKLNKCTSNVSHVLGTETYGKVLGIVGFGRIGKHLCKIARGFEMRVLVYDPYIKELDSTDGKIVPLKQLIAESDYISLHCPLNSETHHMIGMNELKAMKANAVLINTARGGIIDEKSLYKALMDKIIAGAGLDAIEDEPLKENNPLMQLDNVIITPHRLCQTSDSISRQMRSMLQSAISFCKGIIPEESINRSKIDKSVNRVKLH
jgi:D-3-phosphoglycerate dehydrogenase / 2-oxoglutarate reductase